MLIYEEAQRNGVETKKNRDKSSNCDSYVMLTYVVSFTMFWN